MSSNATVNTTLNTSSCASTKAFFDLATNKTYLTSTCVLTTSNSFASATTACSNIGMSLFDVGKSSDIRSNLLSYVNSQSQSFSFWIQDSTLTATCPRLDYIGTLWKENINPNCTDSKQTFCQYPDPACKFKAKLKVNAFMVENISL